MQLKKKLVINHFMTVDYIEMRSYLEKQAEKGWLLKKAGVFLHFERAKPQRLCFTTGIFKKPSKYSNDDLKRRAQYKKGFEDIGWSFLCDSGSIQIFVNNTKEELPTPEFNFLEEYCLLKSSAIHTAVIDLMVSFPLILTSLMVSGYSSMLQNLQIVLSLVAAVVSIAALVYIVLVVIWLLRSSKRVKKDVQRASYPRGLSRMAKVVIPSVIAVLALGLIMPTEFTDESFPFDKAKVLTLRDIGIEEEYTIALPFSSNSSFVVPKSCTYMEQAGEDYIFTRHYEAKNEKIAQSIFNEELENFKSDGRKQSLAKNPMEEWNADEVYYFNKNNDMMLLRKGNEVFVIKSRSDLSALTYKESCMEKLGLLADI